MQNNIILEAVKSFAQVPCVNLEGEGRCVYEKTSLGAGFVNKQAPDAFSANLACVAIMFWH